MNSEDDDNKPLLTRKQMTAFHKRNFERKIDDNIPLGLIIRFLHAQKAILKYKRNYKIYEKQSKNCVTFHKNITKSL